MLQDIKNKMKKNKTFVLGLSVLAVACSGGALSEKLDGGQTNAALGMKVQSNPTNTTSALQAALVTADNLSVTEGKACVEEIKLQLPAGITCDDVSFVKTSGIKCEVENEEEHGAVVSQAEIKIEGPIVFDLVTGEATPSLADIKLPSGMYNEIRFKFDGVCGFGDETSITLKGNMKDSSAVDHPFDLAMEYNDDLRIRSATDIQVLEGQANTVFASLILNTWFANVDFVDCLDHDDLPVNGSGVIEINKDTEATGSCEEIYDDLKDGIEDAMEFEDHGDDDGANHDANDDNGQDDTGDDNGGHGTDDLING